MTKPLVHALSRRERQVMDGLYQHGASTVAEVLAFLPDPPSYSAVRALLRTLGEKGYVQHTREGLRYVYRPMSDRKSESRSALKHVVRTFFGGSTRSVVATLLSDTESLDEKELEQLAKLIDKARSEGR
jgi:predicted transcriptional regulator